MKAVLKKNKWYLVMALLAVGAYTIWHFYTRRRIRIVDFVWGGNFVEGSNAVAYRTQEPHPFNVGDTVEVEMDPGFMYPQYNRDTKVTWISDDRMAFLTSTVWEASGPAFPGNAKLINRG